MSACRPAPGRPSETKWTRGLIRSPSGAPVANLANALHAIREAPHLQGRIRFNEMSARAEVCQPMPWDKGEAFSPRAWSETDDSLLCEWLQRNKLNVKTAIAAGAAETAAREAPFHSVRAYLEGLEWDGKRRIEGWLSTYLGAVTSDYVRAVGQRWLISAVARVYQPGCKADAVLILEGAQGRGKSTALSILGGQWFTDRLSDVRSKDAAEELPGVWIVEMAELQPLAKADASAIKAFVSRVEDRYRPAYGRRTITIKRQCVFAATVNPDEGYLKDATGGRRFWPIATTTIHLAALRADRDELWAEAVAEYKKGTQWWLSLDEERAARKEQEDRYQVDPWMSHVAAFVEGKQETSVRAILNHLGLEVSRQTMKEQTRVAKCLVSMGFEKCRGTEADGRRFYEYRRINFNESLRSPTL